MPGYCPSCGKPLEGKSLGRLCPQCYVSRYGVARLPGTVRIVYCRDCGAYKYQGGWNEGLETLGDTVREFIFMVATTRLKPTSHIEEAWVEGVRLQSEVLGPGVYDALVEVRGRSPQGLDVRDNSVVRVEVVQSLCPKCTSRVTGRGYEAEVKIRGSGGSMSKDLRASVERFLLGLAPSIAEFVVKVDSTREGVDVYLSDQPAARMLASKLRDTFSAEVKESYKLVGRRQSGKRKGRLTLSVRIPDFRPGDIIDVGGTPHLYLGRVRGGIATINLHTGSERVIARDRAKDIRGLFNTGPRLRRFMVLSDDGESIVFLDVDKAMQEVVDAPRGSVEVLTEKLETGRIYEVFIAGNRIYVLRETSDSGV